jgi:preprotein translocase subunit SecG
MLDAIFSWKMVYGLLLSIYVPACLGLIVIVLLQKGKGVGFAGAFGAGPGGADAVFGPRSSKSLPQKITYTMAGIFMTLSLLMSMLSGNLGSSVAPSLVVDSGEVPQNNSSGGVSSIDDLFNAAPAEAPAAEAPAAPAVEAPAAVPVVETPAPAAEVPAPVEAPAAEAPAAQ